MPPVNYTSDSAGPSTRRSGGYEPAYAGESDYSDLTKDELQALLEERGLPTSGNKPELIERLQEND